MTMFQELYGRNMEERLRLLLDDLNAKNVTQFIAKFPKLYFHISSILLKL